VHRPEPASGAHRRSRNRGALLGSAVLLGLLEGSRFAKDVIPFLTGVRLAAAQQILVGVVLVALMIRRPEGLLLRSRVLREGSSVVPRGPFSEGRKRCA
jgi:ABC-type branched-subunit amino acid transport system permease subunit